MTCSYYVHPGIDSSNLVKKLHEDLGVIPVDPKSILQNILTSDNNETQDQLLNDLHKGKCIASRTLFNLIMNELQSSQAVKKNGYILSGIPMYRFLDDDNAKQDNEWISSHDQLEKIFALDNKPNIIIYLFCPDPCLVRLRSLTNTDSNTGKDKKSTAFNNFYTLLISRKR